MDTLRAIFGAPPAAATPSDPPNACTGSVLPFVAVCCGAKAAAAVVLLTFPCSASGRTRAALARLIIRHTETRKPSSPLAPKAQKVQSVKKEIHTYLGSPSPLAAQPNT